MMIMQGYIIEVLWSHTPTSPREHTRTFHERSMRGKFQGTMAATTPMGAHPCISVSISCAQPRKPRVTTEESEHVHIWWYVYQRGSLVPRLSSLTNDRKLGGGLGYEAIIEVHNYVNVRQVMYVPEWW